MRGRGIEIVTDGNEFVLPKKRVGGETLRERLTANAYERILPARYLRKNSDGDVIETTGEMFGRVAAAAVAQAEREHGDDVAGAYSLAIELRCKGVTVYRDRSRRRQVLTTRPREINSPGGRPPDARCCPI